MSCRAVDARPPGEVRRAWIVAQNAQSDRIAKDEVEEAVQGVAIHKRHHEAVGKEFPEETAVEVEIPKAATCRVTEAEMLTFEGGPDGDGFGTFVAGTVAGFTCSGRVEA